MSRNAAPESLLGRYQGKGGGNHCWGGTRVGGRENLVLKPSFDSLRRTFGVVITNKINKSGLAYIYSVQQSNENTTKKCLRLLQLTNL